MRNQYMAKVLVHNKMVTQDQVDAHWAEANDQVDIGQVLVKAGLLQQAMYRNLIRCSSVNSINARPPGAKRPSAGRFSLPRRSLLYPSGASSRVRRPSLPLWYSFSSVFAIRSVSVSPPETRKPRLRAASSSSS